MSTPAARVKTLREEIRRHDELYYKKATPEITDLEYDQLMQELQQLEAAHPGTRHRRQPDAKARRSTPSKG